MISVRWCAVRIAFLFLLSLLCSCSSLLDMRVNGSLSDGVNFGVYRKGSDTLERVSLNSLYVQKEGGGEWTVIWGIEGGGVAVDLIRYGAVPDGFRQMVKAVNLEASQNYRAIANFSRMSGPGLAICDFSIDSGGVINAETCQVKR